MTMAIQLKIKFPCSFVYASLEKVVVTEKIDIKTNKEKVIQWPTCPPPEFTVLSTLPPG